MMYFNKLPPSPYVAKPGSIPAANACAASLSSSSGTFGASGILSNVNSVLANRTAVRTFKF